MFFPNIGAIFPALLSPIQTQEPIEYHLQVLQKEQKSIGRGNYTYSKVVNFNKIHIHVK
jgi:hypothetical protein